MFTNYLCLHTVDFKISQNSLKCPYLGAEEMAWWLRALASLTHGLGLVPSPTWQSQLYINLVMRNPVPCSSLHRHMENTWYTNRQTDKGL